MSSELYWRPAPKDEPSARVLPEPLKKTIARRLWGHDGSLNGEEIRIGHEWDGYLQGLDDAGVSGAGDLLGLIEEHGEVLVWISN